MSLKCGYICCLHCIDSWKKEPQEGVLLCPFCSVVSRNNDIRPKKQLGHLVSIVKELEPRLRDSLQMNPRILKFQVDVTLDVGVASNHLIICDDLRSVQHGYLKQNQEECAERFHSVCVLGAPQVTSGRHHWEVDVGPSKGSVNQPEEILLSSELGFWTVGLRNGELYSAALRL